MSGLVSIKGNKARAMDVVKNVRGVKVGKLIYLGMDEQLEFIEDLIFKMIDAFKEKYPAWYASGGCYLSMPKYLVEPLTQDRYKKFYMKKHQGKPQQGAYHLFDDKLPVYFNYENSIILTHEDALLELPEHQPLMKITGLLSGTLVINFEVVITHGA